MIEPVTHEGYVEVLAHGGCRAQLLDLPGCYVLGGDVDQATVSLAERIPAYYDWLVAHDEYTPRVAGPFAVVVAEVRQVAPNGGLSADAFFAPDAEPVDAEDLDWLLALLGWALDDLAVAYQRVPSPMRGQPLPLARSADAVVAEAALAQARYLSYLNAAPDPAAIQLPRDAPLTLLGQVREVALRRLVTTSDEERARVWDWQGERWSLRKVLRCSVLSARLQTDRLPSEGL